MDFILNNNSNPECFKIFEELFRINFIPIGFFRLVILIKLKSFYTFIVYTILKVLYYTYVIGLISQYMHYAYLLYETDEETFFVSVRTNLYVVPTIL